MTLIPENPEQYKAELKEYYESILYGRVLRMVPRRTGNFGILRDFTDYDPNAKSFLNNYCTKLTIGGIRSWECGEIVHEVVDFTSQGSTVFSTPLLTFLLHLCSLNWEQGLYTYDITRTDCIGSVNDQPLKDAQQFFTEHQGEEVILLYNIPAVSMLQRIERCPYILHGIISEERLNLGILEAQTVILKQMLYYPVVDAPKTKVLCRCADSQIRLPVEDIPDQFAAKFFNTNYYQLYEDRLKKVLHELEEWDAII